MSDAAPNASVSTPASSGGRRRLADPVTRDVLLGIVIAGVSLALVTTRGPEPELAAPEFVAAALTVVIISVRRWHTLLLLAASLVGTAALTLNYDRPTPLMFAVLVLLFTFCVVHDRQRSITVGAIVAVGVYIPTLIAISDTAGDERATIVVVWTLAVVGIADAVRSRRALLSSTEARVQAITEAAETARREQLAGQRLDIARDLHDLLAHNLSVMNVQTGVAAHLLHSDPDAAEEALGIARGAGRDILDELRELLTVLRHDDEPTESLPSFDDIGGLVEAHRSQGMPLEWRTSGVPQPLTPAASLAAYRVVQEATTNAAKHGVGRASLVTTFVDGRLEITVTNPVHPESAGPGNDGHRVRRGTGLGVTGMHERVNGVGGNLAIDTSRPDSYVLRASVPTIPRTAETTEVAT